MNLKYTTNLNFLWLRRSIIISSILIIFISFPISTSYSQNPNEFVYSTNDQPFGEPYNVWISKWMQWNVNIPLEGHPRDSYSPEKCHENQGGPVWYLPDILAGKEDRTCFIPSGKGILFPISTGACWNDGNPQFMTETELKKCAMEGNDYLHFNAYLNDTKLTDLKDDRVQSPAFNITIPRESYTRYSVSETGGIGECEVCPFGNFTAFVDGYFIFLKPLQKGVYDISFSYTTVENPTPDYKHFAELKYHLVVG